MKNSPRGSCYHTPAQKESTSSICFPSHQKEGVAGEYEVSVKLTIVFEIGSVKRFRCNNSKELPNSFLSFYCENILRS